MSFGILLFVWLAIAVAVVEKTAAQMQYQQPPIDLFNSSRAEWHLAYRATSEIDRPVYSSFISPEWRGDRDNFGCQQTIENRPCRSQYRSPLVDQWTALNIDEVALVIYKQLEIKKYLLFDGKGSSHLDWFSPQRLKDSSWRDLKVRKKDIQFFCIPGHDRFSRRFFINNNLNYKCSGDAGWFVVLDDLEHECPWEAGANRYPRFLYADSDGMENWTHGRIGQADMIAVFFKS